MKWKRGGREMLLFFLLSWLDNFFRNAKNQTLNIFITLVTKHNQQPHENIYPV